MENFVLWIVLPFSNVCEEFLRKIEKYEDFFNDRENENVVYKREGENTFKIIFSSGFTKDEIDISSLQESFKRVCLKDSSPDGTNIKIDFRGITFDDTLYESKEIGKNTFKIENHVEFVEKILNIKIDSVDLTNVVFNMFESTSDDALIYTGFFETILEAIDIAFTESANRKISMSIIRGKKMFEQVFDNGNNTDALKELAESGGVEMF